MIISSDTSDISDWEWIAGGFPYRDVVREQIISDSINNLKHDDNTNNSRETNHNSKVEILEGDLHDELLSTQCPISIIPAESTNETQCPISIFPAESTIATQKWTRKTTRLHQ